MKLIAVDHIQLAMPTGQEQAARAFYNGVLGMQELPKPAALAARGGAWFQAGEVILHLGVEIDFKPARKAHPGLLVDDLQAFLSACRAKNLETDTSQPALDGYQRAHVFDPFGNRIELLERL
jgi:catechol 2,3-dioxygenase-like lactoylglutathione lyase family enzyme